MKRHTWSLGVRIGALLIALLAGCQIFGVELLAQTDDESPFTFDHLANLTYLSEFGEDGTVTLSDGLFEAPAADGSAATVSVMLSEFVAEGDLDGDGVAEAAVVLVSNGGGSGSFHDLALVVAGGDGLANVATAPLGDRVEILNFTIDDGLVVVDMLTQGPEDPMCCPSLEVARRYSFDGEALLLESEVEQAAAAPDDVALQPDADPATALLTLGGAEGSWLDPMLVGVISGVAAGGEEVDATGLGSDCVGVLPAAPDVVVDWTADANVASLRFFLLSAGDPVLAVVTPAGDLLCADDFSPLVLDPMLEVSAPEAGRYAIFVGAQEGQPASPALLVMTGGTADPATFALNQLLARPVSNVEGEEADEAATALPTLSAADALLLDGGPEPLALSADEALTLTVDAGGPVAAFELALSNPLCTGFVESAPVARFEAAAAGEALNLFVESEADTTLVVRAPDGSWLCADDSPAVAADAEEADAAASDAPNEEAAAEAGPNLNPQLLAESMEGIYSVWVGAFAADEVAPATLTISSDNALLPALLQPLLKPRVPFNN